MHVGMSAFFQNLTGSHTDADVYRHELSMAELAEPLGFDGIWAPEHHFDNYTMCPNVIQFLTWMAARTSRVKLGSMVVVLPWHDPMWVAEQFSVLDHMSGGRAILGIGRGLGRIEFDGYRVPMAESQAPSMILPSGGNFTPAAALSVGSQSVPLTGSELSAPALIFPGQRTIPGTRIPPS